MSVPAVSIPVAVLVLAWDETTPAVRALVEATELAEPVLDSVMVLVPAGPATGALTQEEFLPLDASVLPKLTPPPVPAEWQPASTAGAAAAAKATPAPATTPAPAFLPAAAPTTATSLPAALPISTAANFTPALPDPE
ncbi:MAG: hypothetical protein EOO36_16815, partial [Cytophagaceae bacterium]